jgi:dienelactone hydrolase
MTARNPNVAAGAARNPDVAAGAARTPDVAAGAVRTPDVAAGAAPEADLTGWTAEPFTAAGYTHDVYRKGEGPGVVLIPEMPGIHPGVLGLGNHLVDNGFTVALPSLYGTPGAPGVRPGMVPIMLRGCVAKEFAAFATNADRPIAHYLRALARDLNERTPGKGVGVIGECWSGGFALAAAVDDSVLAPVLSQPSLPIGLTAKQKADPGLSEAELKIVERRVAEDGLCALGLRFSEDSLSPAARFKTLKARLGDAFEVIEIDSKKGNEHGFGKRAHSVLTLEVREMDGHPAYEARNRVVAFLNERLRDG